MHISVILGELANFHHLGGFGASKTINIPLGLLVFPAPGPKSPPIGGKPQNLVEFSDFHQNLANSPKITEICINLVEFGGISGNLENFQYFMVFM